jgi:hypothetical protein
MFLGIRTVSESISFTMDNLKLVIFVVLGFIFTILTITAFNATLGKDIIGEFTLIHQLDQRTDISAREKLMILESRKETAKSRSKEDFLVGFLKEADLRKIFLVFLWYLSLAFIATFFGVGLASCTWDALNGKEVSILKGLTTAVSNIWSIFLWSLFSSTVGIILGLIEHKFERVGKAVKGIIGFVWSYAAFFVIPIVATERISPFRALSKSGNFFIKHLGDVVVGQLSLNVVFIAISVLLIPVILLVGITFLFPLSQSGIDNFFMILLGSLALFCVFGATIQNVYITNLYYSITKRDNALL